MSGKLPPEERQGELAGCNPAPEDGALDFVTEIDPGSQKKPPEDRRKETRSRCITALVDTNQAG